MSFQAAFDRLLAYEPKRLVMGSYECDRGHCVMGAIVPQSRRFGARGLESVLMDPAVFAELQSLDLRIEEAIAIVEANDAFRFCLFGDDLDEERYKYMVEFLRVGASKERAHG